MEGSQENVPISGVGKSGCVAGYPNTDMGNATVRWVMRLKLGSGKHHRKDWEGSRDHGGVQIYSGGIRANEEVVGSTTLITTSRAASVDNWESREYPPGSRLFLLASFSRVLLDIDALKLL